MPYGQRSCDSQRACHPFIFLLPIRTGHGEVRQAFGVEMCIILRLASRPRTKRLIATILGVRTADETLHFITSAEVPFTNNQAERDQREGEKFLVTFVQ